jgi:hypothetical protein
MESINLYFITPAFKCGQFYRSKYVIIFRYISAIGDIQYDITYKSKVAPVLQLSTTPWRRTGGVEV